MFAAFVLLLVALTAVLYRDRDYWFPDTEADDQLLSPPEAQDTAASGPAQSLGPESAKKKSRKHEARDKKSEVASDPPPSDPPPSDAPTVTRTVLPPLEVEVVAGDAHRTVRPGSNAIRVELQRPTSGQGFTSAPEETTAATARVATAAAQRTSIRAAAATGIVSHSVQPDYPMLARQMKVQGSVVLQALVGRDGLIQDLRILSGPKILAIAAEDAVRQWHFKPQFVGSEPVETRANITVNFTISTN